MMVLGRWGKLPFRTRKRGWLLTAPTGSDLWLIDIIESVLAKLELPTEVLCGKNTFEV